MKMTVFLDALDKILIGPIDICTFNNFKMKQNGVVFILNLECLIGNSSNVYENAAEELYKYLRTKRFWSKCLSKINFFSSFRLFKVTLR